MADVEHFMAMLKRAVANDRALPNCIDLAPQAIEIIALLAARAEAFEGAQRISIWNACMAANMDQDAAIQTVERRIGEIERKAIEAAARLTAGSRPSTSRERNMQNRLQNSPAIQA